MNGVPKGRAGRGAYPVWMIANIFVSVRGANASLLKKLIFLGSTFRKVCGYNLGTLNHRQFRKEHLMKYRWNSAITKAITEKRNLIKGKLDQAHPEVTQIITILSELHPEVPVDVIKTSAEKIHDGVSETGADIDRHMELEYASLQSSAQDILAGQMAHLSSDEARKGYLCKIFESLKKGDETTDGHLRDVSVNETDVAKLSTDELQSTVAEQLANSIISLSYEIMSSGLDGVSKAGDITLYSEEDAFLLAIAQYSESLNGTITYEFSNVPKLLGQCAAAQQRICVYCKKISAEDITEEERMSKILMVFAVILAVLFAIGFGLLTALLMDPLLTGAFAAAEAVFGTGVLSTIAKILLSYPAACIAMVLAAGSICGAGIAIESLSNVFAASAPKMKDFYKKISAKLNIEKTPKKTDAENAQKSRATTSAEVMG